MGSSLLVTKSFIKICVKYSLFLFIQGSVNLKIWLVLGTHRYQIFYISYGDRPIPRYSSVPKFTEISLGTRVLLTRTPDIFIKNCMFKNVTLSS